MNLSYRVILNQTGRWLTGILWSKVHGTLDANLPAAIKSQTLRVANLVLTLRQLRA